MRDYNWFIRHHPMPAKIKAQIQEEANGEARGLVALILVQVCGAALFLLIALALYMNWHGLSEAVRVYGIGGLTVGVTIALALGLLY